ncbi:MAG: arginine--tRNA ligase [Bacillaceae bacterium]
MDYKKLYAEELHKGLSEHLDLETIYGLIETPKHETHGDLAFPCFPLAKALRKSPMMIATDVAAMIDSPTFSKVEAVGPYVNVFLSREFASKDTLNTVLTAKEHYGDLTEGTGKTAVVEFSSPNIAKPFSMGHLRSTVIGHSLAYIAEKCGYDVVRLNHVGDWGTQFGKLIYAYKEWGSEEAVKAHPIRELLKLYVEFHDRLETEPELEEEGRKWFKKLEDGDEEATRLWTWFREESLQEFSRIYDLMGVKFDSYNGEAFYADKMDAVADELEAKGLLVESKGAQVVSLEEEGLPPCLVRKSDGATLYATRDLAAAIYRQNTYHFDKLIYVVGGEQALHFTQFFTVLQKMGHDWVKGAKHVPFGLMMKDGQKMSTRKGKVVLLEEVIEEAISLAKQSIEEKNPSLANKEEVARQVGVGAVIFQDLKNERTNNIDFSLEHMLKFEGETGPYVQYTNARANSILRKGNFVPTEEINGLNDDLSWSIVKLIHAFPAVIQRSFNRYEPSVISKYLLDLAQAFNKYYGNTRILEEDNMLQSRLNLVYAVTIVLTEGLRLLGISAPEEM